MININEYLLSKSKDNGIVFANDNNVFEIVHKAIEERGNDADLNYIDVSACTTFCFSMNGIYKGLFERTDFQGDISEWDVSNVKDMRFTFAHCKNFNSDISKWDVSNVKTMRKMFYLCESFNADISDWDVSNVEDMDCILYMCKSFDRDLSKWDVNNVTTGYHYAVYGTKTYNVAVYWPKFKRK